MTDLIPLYDSVAASPLLAESIGLLVLGLADILDKEPGADIAEALRSEIKHPDDQNRLVSMAKLLGEALTRNTSHLAVNLRDEVGSIRLAVVERLSKLDPAKRAEHSDALIKDVQDLLVKDQAEVVVDPAPVEKAPE